MAISISKPLHILRNQKCSLELLLWPPHHGKYAALACRRFPHSPLHNHLHIPSHSPPLRHCRLLPTTPIVPLHRRRLLPLFSPMSSLNGTESSSPLADKTVRVVVKGRVQGVFYRNWTIENANQLGLKGWVRNRRDGSVESLFSGNPEKVQEMEQRCRRGPPDAMVTGFQVFPSTDDPGTVFERKSTV